MTYIIKVLLHSAIMIYALYLSSRKKIDTRAFLLIWAQFMLSIW